MNILRRLRYLLRQRQQECELAEEIEFHRQMSGDPCAMRNITRAREEARAVWIWPWLQSVWQDTVYAIRNLPLPAGVGAAGIIFALCGFAPAAPYGIVAARSPDQSQCMLRFCAWLPCLGCFSRAGRGGTGGSGTSFKQSADGKAMGSHWQGPRPWTRLAGLGRSRLRSSSCLRAPCWWCFRRARTSASSR